jgi:hypothetical protein
MDRECEMITGEIAYRNRHDLHHKKFWQCPVCKNFVGTHNKGTGTKPLGCIPTKEIKNARQHIHKILDPLWKNRQMSRTEVYAKISSAIGREYHTAEIRSVDEARQIYLVVKNISKEASWG